LAATQEDADTQLAQYKADLRTEFEQKKINLENDRLLGKWASRTHNCPNPIRVYRKATRPACSQSTSSHASATPEPQDVDMGPTTVPTSEQEGNSPTPTANTSLAPTVPPAEYPKVTTLGEGLDQVSP